MAAKKKPRKATATKPSYFKTSAVKELKGALVTTAEEMGHVVPIAARELLEMAAELILVGLE